MTSRRRSLWGRVRPTPSMILALTALFVAMSGTTWAVTQLPKRSVGSIQLKRGAVRSENISKGAVTASKLDKGLVSAKAKWADGAGIADHAAHAARATLADSATTATSAGSTASASTAGDADRLDGKDSTDFLSTSTLVSVPRFSLTAGETRDIPIPGAGPFSFTARCSIGEPAGHDIAEIEITTSEAHSAVDSFDLAADFGPGNPQRLIGVDSPTGKAAFESLAEGTAVAPSGGEIRSMVFWTGVNIFGPQQKGKCWFGGLAFV